MFSSEANPQATKMINRPMMRTPKGRVRARRMRVARTAAVALAFTGVALLSGCDLGVITPDRTEDADLDDDRVLTSIVNGAISTYSVAAGGGPTAGAAAGIHMSGSLLTDEVVHSGGQLAYRNLSDGRIVDDENQFNWDRASQARWTAERAIARITDLVDDPASHPDIARATLWAGFSNRMIGDNFCEGVIDGGGVESHTAFFDRGADHFANAIAVGAAAGAAAEDDDELAEEMVELVMAAHAGRAQIRMMQGDWAGAEADAATVDTEFQLAQIHSAAGQSWNRYSAHGREALASITVWGTPFAEWGENLDLPIEERDGDPRVVFDIARDSETDEVVRGPDDRRPYWRQYKFGTSSINSTVVRGTEMRLIEGEAALVRGDWQTAIARINEVREHNNVFEGHDLEMVEASNEDEAWELLMRERGLEMWLEGRRLPDMRRWAETPGSVPFTVVRREAVGEAASADPRMPVLEVERMCLPISDRERASNPNL